MYAKSLIVGLAVWFFTLDAVAADFNRGVSAYQDGDFATAYAEWLPLAENGDLAAQYNLAVLLEYGLGVARDLGAAVDWYTRAAEAGYPLAQVKIGDFYQSGFWGTGRLTDAIDWYRLAAEQGDGTAAEKLASLGVAHGGTVEPGLPASTAQEGMGAIPGRLDGEAGCPPRADRNFKVDVTISIPKPPINRNLSSHQLTEKTFHDPNARILGLTIPDLTIRTSVEHATEERSGFYCYWLVSVEAELVYHSIEVYIAREYEPGSCEYRAILRHEQEHVAIARRNLEKYKPKVRYALTSLLLPTPDRPIQLASLDETEPTFDALFNKVLQPVYRDMQEDLTRAQAAIDTQESYARVRAKCFNW